MFDSPLVATKTGCPDNPPRRPRTLSRARHRRAPRRRAATTHERRCSRSGSTVMHLVASILQWIGLEAISTSTVQQHANDKPTTKHQPSLKRHCCRCCSADEGCTPRADAFTYGLRSKCAVTWHPLPSSVLELALLQYKSEVVMCVASLACVWMLRSFMAGVRCASVQRTSQPLGWMGVNRHSRNG